MITKTILAVILASGTAGAEVLTPLWTTFVGTEKQDYGRQLSVDSRGILLAGATLGELATPSNGSSDAFIARLSSDGDVNWKAQEGQDRIDLGVAAVSSFGRVYLCGYSQLPDQPGQTMFVSQYDSHGNFCWRKYLGQGDVLSATSDRWGNVIVTGARNSISISVAKLNRCGRLLWRVDEGGRDSYDVAVDRFGNVFITGRGRKAFVAKYDRCGRKCWRKELEIKGMPPTHAGWGVTADSQGNAYVCGWIGIQAKDGSFVIKLDKQGEIQETLIHHESGHRFNKIDIRNGRVVVGGDDGASPKGRLFILTSNDSLHGYVKHWLHEEKEGRGQLRGLKIDKSGDICASGWFSGRLNGQTTHIRHDAFVVKYRLTK